MLFSTSDLRSTQDAFCEALMKIGLKNPKIVVLDSDSQHITKTHLFSKYCAERYFNLGLSCSDVIGSAIGLAIQGFIPIVCNRALYVTGKDWEQIRNCICYLNLNIKFVGVLSGLSSSKEGPLSQSYEDIALMRSFPNMKIFCPADSIECALIVDHILRDFGPTYLRLHSFLVPSIYDEKSYYFKCGHGDVLQRGEKVCLMSYGCLLMNCIKASELLQQEGISVGVINMPSIKPIDESFIAEIAQHYAQIVVVEDHNVIGGLGSSICEIASRFSQVTVHRIGIPDRFGEPSDIDQLVETFHFSPKRLSLRVKEIWHR